VEPCRSLLVRLGGLTAVALSACGVDLEVSPPPDVAPIVTDYREPSGAVGGTDLEVLGREVGLAYETVADSTFGFAPQLVEALFAMARDLDVDDEPGVEREDIAPLERSRLIARADVEFVCPGIESGSGVAPGRDGRVDLEGAVDRQGLFPVLWGRASACRSRVGSIPIQLDGELAAIVDAGRSRIRTRDLTREPIIVVYRGDLTLIDEGRTFDDVRIDLRRSRSRIVLFDGVDLALESEAIESRIIIDSEVFIVSFAETRIFATPPARLTFALRASDGLWSCSLSTASQTGRCENERTEERLEWP